MRRWRCAFVLLLPCLSGCTFAMEEGWYDSMKVLEFSGKQPSATTVAYSERTAN